MKKFAEFIVKYKWLFFVLFAAMVAASFVMLPRVQVNYDNSKYLPDDMDSKKALVIMDGELGQTSSLKIMLSGVTAAEAESAAAEVGKVENVLISSFSAGEDGFKDADGDGLGEALIKVTLSGSTYSPETEKTVREIEALFENRDAVMSGGVLENLRLQAAITKEIPIILAVAVAIVLVVLFLTSTSWLEPLIFLFVIFVAIIINMGTNMLLGEISYIAHSISAILQLALAMDYSIILLHNFDGEKRSGLAPKEAMVSALAKSVNPILSSSLTTVAGLVALMFMSFTIGLDIGLVLAKGIILSMISVIFLMPGIVLALSKLLNKTRKKPLPLAGERVAGFSLKIRKVFPIVMVLVIVFTGIVQNYNVYSFSDASASKESEQISAVFGDETQMLAIVPKAESDEDYRTQKNFIAEISENATLKEVSGIVTTGLVDRLTAAETAELSGIGKTFINAIYYEMGYSASDKVRLCDIIDYIYAHMDDSGSICSWIDAAAREKFNEIYALKEKAFHSFNGEKYTMLAFSISADKEDKESEEFIVALKETLNKYYDENYIAGEPMVYYDISQTFMSDVLKINLITLISILIIIAVTFKSVSLPFILVLVIQGAIWISMSITTLSGGAIFFMSYLIVSAIQMGATIDYGILLTTNYMERRKTLGKREAVIESVKASIATVFTSGTIMIIAGFTVGLISTSVAISSIGTLVGRGAIVSTLLVLLLLPALLYIFDSFIKKTTFTKDLIQERKKKKDEKQS